MKNKHAVMYFDTEINLGISTQPNKWVNYKTNYYDNGFEALKEFLASDSITTHLISGDNDAQLQEECNKTIRRFCSEEWVNKLLS